MEKTLFLMPNLTSAKHVRDDLLKKGFDPDDVQVISKNNMGLEFFDGKEAPLTTYTDMIPSIIRGFIIGGLMGLLSYLCMNIYYNLKGIPIGSVYGWLFACCMIGGWISMLIGVSVIKPKFKAYMHYVQNGYALLIIKKLKPKYIDFLTEQHPVEMAESC